MKPSDNTFIFRAAESGILNIPFILNVKVILAMVIAREFSCSKEVK